MGLTDLRNANLGEKGRYYTAFFQLAIGIERMAKLALILDHMAKNSLRPPGKQAVRGYGHDLVSLIAKVKAISVADGHAFAANFTFNPLADRVLCFLSDFNEGMRYANLDALASGSAHRKPLDEWNQILEHVITTKIQPSTQNRITEQSMTVAQAIEEVTFSLAHDLSGQPLTTATALSTPRLLDAASRHLVWETLGLLAPMRDFIVTSGDSAQQDPTCTSANVACMPYMSKFFDFIWLDRTYVFRKKRWP
jgi:hypothetical protein